MLIVIYLLFFATVCAVLANKYNKEIVEVLPVVFSGLVLILYILAFFNQMWLADVIVAAVTLIILVIAYRTKANVYAAVKKFYTPSVFVFAAVSLVGIIALSNRGIFSNDDLAFWAIDTKTIFSLQGFSGAGLHTIPEYGDYQPASQLIEAWFMHIMGGYDEGLMFSAYFLAMQVYTAPVLKKLPAKVTTVALAFVWLFFIYSFGPNVMFDLSADVLMAVVYGSVLMLAFMWKNKGLMQYIGLALMLMVLTLMKSVGIQWAMFALIFIILMEKPFWKLKKEQLVLLAPGISWLSWNIFCKISGRTAYLTEILKSSVQGQSDKALYLEYGEAMKNSFFKALRFNQQTSSVNIGLSVIDFIILFLLFLIIWRLIKLIDKDEFFKMFSFMLVTGVVEYAILLFSVLTMFIDEKWYTEYQYMLILLKRYGAPYIIGFLLVVICVLFERISEDTFDFLKLKISLKNKQQIAWCAVIAVQLLLVPFDQEMKKYVTYRSNTTPDEYNFNEAVSELTMEERYPYVVETVNALSTLDNPDKEKILIIHDETVWKEYNLRDVRYYAAPLAVYSKSVLKADDVNLKNEIEKNDYTGICFVSSDSDWKILKEFEEGKTLSLYNIYKVSVVDGEVKIENQQLK